MTEEKIIMKAIVVTDQLDAIAAIVSGFDIRLGCSTKDCDELTVYTHRHSIRANPSDSDSRCNDRHAFQRGQLLRCK